MAVARVQNNDWLEDEFLKEEMKKHVRQGLRCKEILDYLTRYFPQYAWSFRTLDRRLRAFNIFFTDKDVSVEQVKEAVQHEIEGPGKLLGYRAMQNKIRQVHGLNVPRDLVYAAMYDIDAEGLAARRPGQKNCKKKGHYVTEGVNWVYSLDGHDKLMGFQNSTFPLVVYGCLDTASRKLLWLKIWTSNSDPKLIEKWYLEYLFESRTLPSIIRIDKGRETETLATMQAYLRQHGDIDPVNTVIYGPSTSNQIEHWWRELHERLEKFFKPQLKRLTEEGNYDPSSMSDRMMVAFIYIPVLQHELDVFRETIWNSHRIRNQRDTSLPDGVPDHIFDFPEQYGLRDCGFAATEHQLEEVANHSGVLEAEDDYLAQEFRERCQEIIPYPGRIEPEKCFDSFLYLKENMSESYLNSTISSSCVAE